MAFSGLIFVKHQFLLTSPVLKLIHIW